MIKNGPSSQPPLSFLPKGWQFWTPLRHLLPILTFLLLAAPGTYAQENPPPTSPLAREVAFDLRYGGVPSSSVVPRPGQSRDKTLHALVSMGLVVGAYYGGTQVVGWPKNTSLGVAAGGTVAIGLLKELYDRSEIGGQFSGGDMLFNLVGTGLGVGLVLGVDQ